MRVAIFAEGSRTTADLSGDGTARDYFLGTFQPVAVLDKELSEHAATELHILSEQYGHLLGDTPIDRISEDSTEPSEAEEKFADAIVTAASDAEVIIILLSSTIFRNTVADYWNEIISNARENTIWCIGASKGALQSIDLAELKNKTGSVLIYERVGVAPLGQNTRDELIRRVRARCDQKS